MEEVGVSIGEWKPRRMRPCVDCRQDFWPTGPTSKRCDRCRATYLGRALAPEPAPPEPDVDLFPAEDEDDERPEWLIERLAETTVEGLLRRIENPALAGTAALAREELARRRAAGAPTCPHCMEVIDAHA